MNRKEKTDGFIKKRKTDRHIEKLAGKKTGI